MKSAFLVARREFFSYLVSPVFFIVLAAFLFLAGYFFFSLLSSFNIMISQYLSLPARDGVAAPGITAHVLKGYFHALVFLLVLVVPLLSMKVFAEEYEVGSFEFLFTAPISLTQIAVGKFLGLAGIVFLFCFSASIYPFFLLFVSNPEPGLLYSGFLGTLFSGLACAGIGLSVSAWSRNQLTAAFLSLVILFVLYGISSPAQSVEGALGTTLNFISLMARASESIDGVLSLSSVMYYVSLMIFGVVLTHYALERRRSLSGE